MNRRAAPGVDGIRTQCIKEAWKGDNKEDPMCHILAPHLTKLFNIIFDSGIYPEEWTVTTITPIFKGKGSKDTESNYRGISVAGALAKLYGVVISGRLTRHLEINNLRAWSQAGGRPEIGVLQHHFALQHFKDLLLLLLLLRTFIGHRLTKVVRESHFLSALSTSKRHLIG